MFKGQSPSQELEEGMHSGPYLLVINEIRLTFEDTDLSMNLAKRVNFISHSQNTKFKFAIIPTRQEIHWSPVGGTLCIYLLFLSRFVIFIWVPLI